MSPINVTTRLFFDASCLIAAAGSPTGGSGFLLSLCSRRLLIGTISQAVLWEAEQNIHAKLGTDSLTRYHQLLQTVPFVLLAIPPLPTQQIWERYINYKDTHVVAAMLSTGVDLLVTLDRKLIDEIHETQTGIRAFTPGDFIRQLLPHHENFSNLRE